MKKLLNQYLIIVFILFIFINCIGCWNDSDNEQEAEINGVLWTSNIAGGFDDFGSAGAALGYSINESDGMIMILGVKFTLPLYQTEFTPDSDSVDNAELYEWGITNSVLEDDVVTYPLLAYGITNTTGLRTSLNNNFIGILLKGDFSNSTPDKIYIATRGSINLTREDEPNDIVDGSLEFTEIEKNGYSYSIKSDSDKLQYKIYYSWDTEDQP